MHNLGLMHLVIELVEQSFNVCSPIMIIMLLVQTILFPRIVFFFILQNAYFFPCTS